MGKVDRFEDLECWQLAKELMNKIYDMTKNSSFYKDWELKSQLRRSALSSMANIAEGFARFHKKDFLRFLDISQSSAAEVKSHLYIVIDQNYIDAKETKKIQAQAVEVRKKTLGLARYVKRSIK